MTTEEKKIENKTSQKTPGKYFVCPFHGKVEGIETQISRKVPVTDKNKKETLVDKQINGFRCPNDGCEVTRTEKECE